MYPCGLGVLVVGLGGYEDGGLHHGLRMARVLCHGQLQHMSIGTVGGDVGMPYFFTNPSALQLSTTATYMVWYWSG